MRFSFTFKSHIPILFVVIFGVGEASGQQSMTVDNLNQLIQGEWHWTGGVCGDTSREYVSADGSIEIEGNRGRVNQFVDQENGAPLCVRKIAFTVEVSGGKMTWKNPSVTDHGNCGSLAPPAGDISFDIVRMAKDSDGKALHWQPTGGFIRSRLNCWKWRSKWSR